MESLMKIYPYNPHTGRRGFCPVDTKPKMRWTSPSLNYLVETGLYDLSETSLAPLPGYKGGAVWAIYEDAGGTTASGRQISYRDARYWRCFTIGPAPLEEDPYQQWQWIILPSENFLKSVEIKPHPSLGVE